MKNQLILFLLLLVTGMQRSDARENKDLTKANYLYNHLAFHEAIQYYQKISADNDAILLSKLGDCYRLTNDPQEACTYYAKAVAINNCPDDTRLHYAAMLMNLQRYNDALILLKQYQKVKPDDHRVANMITSCQQAPAMMKKLPAATITFQNFNTDGSDFGPAIRHNEIFFTADTSMGRHAKKDAWTGSSFYQLYQVKCDGTAQCSSILSGLGNNINTKYHDGPCTFTADGSKMYFTRTNYKQVVLNKQPIADKSDVVHLEIMVAEDYNDADDHYKKVRPFVFNNKNYSVAHPAISKDGNTLIFSSDMPGGYGGTDLYICRKDNSGNWSKPQNLGAAINTEGDELFPSFGNDNTIYFASNGLIGLGGLDMYQSRWDGNGNSFSAPENMGMPINSSYDDMSLTIKDDDNGYFASDRPAPKGNDNVYSYSRQQIFLSLRAEDAVTGQPLPDVNIALQSAVDDRSAVTNNDGHLFTQIYPKASYNIKAAKPGYDAAILDISTLGVDKSDTLRRTIKLQPDFAITFKAVVLDAVTHESIPDAAIVFYENGAAKADTTMLPAEQGFSATLKKNKTYNIYALKDNYYGNEKVFSTNDINPDAGSVNIKDTLFMKKLQVGEVYKIDNIYYDYNKANIRVDAKPSLNRLIELLNHYPNMQIQVNSHTDCRGSAPYNIKLSDARAHSVIKYLQEKGISNTRLKAKGYGKTMPVEKCACAKCTEAQYQANRRTEFQITSL